MIEKTIRQRVFSARELFARDFSLAKSSLFSIEGFYLWNQIPFAHFSSAQVSSPKTKIQSIDTLSNLRVKRCLQGSFFFEKDELFDVFQPKLDPELYCFRVKLLYSISENDSSLNAYRDDEDELLFRMHLKCMAAYSKFTIPLDQLKGKDQPYLF